jgi:hypothetical protein
VKVSTALQRAQALIVSKRRWTTGEFAQDVAGHSIPVCHPEAVRFCAMGALWRTTCIAGQVESPGELYMDSLAAEYGKDSGSEVNDWDGHAAVMRLYDLAISAAMSDEAAK